MTISRADFLNCGMRSTGMPRPSSTTVAEPSALSWIQTFLANPARASSTALSMISRRDSWRPMMSVEPMYIPGLLRTGSRPSRTWICCAE